MPDGGPRYQLIDGELHGNPTPGVFHQEIAWNLSQIFGRYLEDHPAGRFYLAPYDVYLSRHDVVQPDLLFIEHSRLHLRQDDGLHGAPDLAIEILSPSTALLDTKSKRALYARSGVKELWIVDPVRHQIHRYDFSRSATEPVRVLGEGETFGSPLLPGLTVDATAVFRR
jgi:Uma2 family endonuclease